MIELRSISKAYGDKTVLSGFNLTLEPGGDYCVTGASGSGKTTLLHIIMGLTAPDSGVISGVEGLALAPVFQEDRLCMSLSVGANIRLTARRRLSAREIGETLDSLMLPGSIRTPVRELSGGMRRRVALARAILSDGGLWLFDEPFTSLDPETKRKVMDVLRARRGERTMIWVTHDLSDARYMGSSVIRL